MPKQGPSGVGFAAPSPGPLCWRTKDRVGYHCAFPLATRYAHVYASNLAVKSDEGWETVPRELLFGLLKHLTWPWQEVCLVVV